MATLAQYAEQARTGNYVGIPYSELDCQAFVERVLKDLGVRDCSGKAYNWRGTNDMWRTALQWKGTCDQAAATFGGLQPGMWLFTVKNDGGEVDRGYHDTEGNAAHVGIYLGNGKVIHSTTGGVAIVDYPAKRWTHAGILSCLTLDTTKEPTPATATNDPKAEIRAMIADSRHMLDLIESLL